MVSSQLCYIKKATTVPVYSAKSEDITTAAALWSRMLNKSYAAQILNKLKYQCGRARFILVWLFHFTVLHFSVFVKHLYTSLQYITMNAAMS